MGTKHELLTAEEAESYSIDSRIEEQLEQYLKKNPDKNPEDIHILDWGCGRGRAVLKLLEKGFSAYGADLDFTTIKNGAPLFKERGFNPQKHMKHVDDLNDFPDGFFQFIFSEQVFEHIENLEGVIQTQSRLTSQGGLGCHVFPSSKMVIECHLNMPVVHWLPKNSTRKYWISLMRLLSKKPEITWPETKGISFWEEVNIYYKYLNNKTFYRDNHEIKQLFLSCEFEADYIIEGTDSPKRKWLPDVLLRNGFPDQQVCFIVKKT